MNGKGEKGKVAVTEDRRKEESKEGGKKVGRKDEKKDKRRYGKLPCSYSKICDSAT